MEVGKALCEGRREKAEASPVSEAMGIGQLVNTAILVCVVCPVFSLEE